MNESSFFGLTPERIQELLRETFDEFGVTPIVVRSGVMQNKIVSERLELFLARYDDVNEKLFLAYSLGRTLVQLEADVLHLQYAASQFFKFVEEADSNDALTSGNNIS